MDLLFPKLYNTWQKAVIPVAKVINYEQIQCEKICFYVWLANRWVPTDALKTKYKYATETT